MGCPDVLKCTSMPVKGLVSADFYCIYIYYYIYIFIVSRFSYSKP